MGLVRDKTEEGMTTVPLLPVSHTILLPSEDTFSRKCDQKCVASLRCNVFLLVFCCIESIQYGTILRCSTKRPRPQLQRHHHHHSSSENGVIRQTKIAPTTAVVP
eukprot:scaffold1341_cov178-Amphora_coffeaeformis.AAC.36